MFKTINQVDYKCLLQLPHYLTGIGILNSWPIFLAVDSFDSF